MLLPDQELRALLLQSKTIDVATLQSVIASAANTQVSLEEALVEKNVVTEEQLGLLVANYIKVPYVNLGKITIPEDVFRIVPSRVARKFHMIAFARDADGIKLAMTNPRDTFLQQMIMHKTKQKVTAYLATERDISNTLQIYRKDLQQVFGQFIQEDLADGLAMHEDAPIAKIVDMLINFAYQDKASDIHIEPEEQDLLIRFRIDGILHDVLRLNKNLSDRVITRIKVLSRLRTDEHLSAQDGKMRLQLEEENLDIRVSIIPIAEGEKVVMRLLSSKSNQLSLLDLGMNESDLKKVNAAINKSYGMILSTGPTGSGKTTSIYSILKILNTREKNITTIEDPVEYRIRGVNQIQVNVKTNLTFANGLRSILRQDPNVIFVGEIRDSETAGIAVNAALTGHLVLSTLHTNDAATALPRLVDMKVEPFLVASTVNVIIAQRLVRKICDVCKGPQTIVVAEIAKHIPREFLIKHFGAAAQIQVFQGRGCKVCHFTGYISRIGIFEVLEMTQTVKKLITDKEDSDVITKQAMSEGMMTMLDDGLDKVKKGMTTIEEVLRVTKVESLT
ncbi:MAG TPA: GspE/PulE family protein [Candidatus Eisenbacteria bacterium]|nr:GspE/PulE family protein [Candidatus Eisenbacteria bacterium]